MLDNLRFQEIEKAIFRVREDGLYGTKFLKKGEPFMIIDNASISNFSVSQRDKNFIGRSTEAGTSTIRNVTFSLANGSLMLNLFNSIFGKSRKDARTTATVNDTAALIETDTFNLPSQPVGEVMLYLTDDYGVLTKIATDQYSIEGQRVTFIKPINRVITYVYEEEVTSSVLTSIRQLGTELVLSLEMQCQAMDILTEEKINVIIRFDKVSVGTNLYISFNNSEKGSGSIIYVQGLAEDNQNAVNKEIFTIEVI